MKQTLTYQPHRFGAHSCRLRVEGFPDVSTGQAGDAVGIVTGWSLEWVGHPELEGRREHLQALMAAVIPYARHLLSGVPRAMGGEEDPVTIAPDGHGGHRMQLRSSQLNTPPLQLVLDDAELADLVRVLDQCRLDPRMQLPLPVPAPLPLPTRELRHRLPLQRRLAAPLGGLAALALAAGTGTLVPTPRPSNPSPQAQAAAPSSSQGSTAPKPTAEGAAPSAAGQTSTAASSEARLKRLRSWLLGRTPAEGLGSSPQVWQLLVSPQGEVVAATPVEGNQGQGRSGLGLPSAAVPNNPTGDTLLVRGVLQPSGIWELSPWHGW